jgi:hypothetical protein
VLSLTSASSIFRIGSGSPRMIAAEASARRQDDLCHYRLHGGEFLHSQIWPLIWENNVGVDQAAIWRFTQDEGAAPGRAAVVVRAEFPGLARAL